MGQTHETQTVKVNFEEKLREVALPIRLLDHAIGALANEGVDNPAGAFLKAHDRAGDDLWEALEISVQGFRELTDVHGTELSEAFMSGQAGAFRTAVTFYLGHDVARAITDEEILTINAEVWEDLYSTELPRGRSLTAIAEAVDRLLVILHQRCMVSASESAQVFMSVREGVLKAVADAEEIRARPSITERIREHRLNSMTGRKGVGAPKDVAGETPDTDPGHLTEAELLALLEEGGPAALQRILPEYFAADDERRKHLMHLVDQVANRKPGESGAA